MGTLQRACARHVERAKILKLSPTQKKHDATAYLLGVAFGLSIMGDDDTAMQIGRFAKQEVALWGYDKVVEMAAVTEETPDA